MLQLLNLQVPQRDCHQLNLAHTLLHRRASLRFSLLCSRPVNRRRSHQLVQLLNRRSNRHMNLLPVHLRNRHSNLADNLPDNQFERQPVTRPDNQRERQLVNRVGSRLENLLGSRLVCPVGSRHANRHVFLLSNHLDILQAHHQCNLWGLLPMYRQEILVIIRHRNQQVNPLLSLLVGLIQCHPDSRL